LQLENFEARIDSVTIDEECYEPKGFNEQIEPNPVKPLVLVEVFLKNDGDWHP